MKICVIDGMGGGIGNALIRKIIAAFRDQVDIIALGTNAIATAQMMKAGANKGATGERAIMRTSSRVDVIVGPLAIVVPDAMMGELTPGMASAVSTSEAKKILVPLTQESIELVGVTGEPLPHLVDQVVEIIKEMDSHV